MMGLTKVLQWICSNLRNLLLPIPIHNCTDSVPVRFGHGLRLLHGRLKAGNVLFDGEGRIQFVDFCPMRRDGEGEGGGSMERTGRRGRMFRRLRCSSSRSWPGILRLIQALHGGK
jgi:hypothetical protein